MSDPDPAPVSGAAVGKHASATEAVTWPVRVAAAWCWRLLVIGTVLYLLGKIFTRIELVAFSFVLALFLTAVLHPLERQLRRVVPGPRSLSAGLALLIGVAVLAGITWFVSWQISDHSTQLGNQLTSFVDKARNWLEHGPLHLKSGQLNKIVDNITASIKNHQDQLISGAIQTVRTVVEALGAILLILLSTFFLGSFVPLIGLTVTGALCCAVALLEHGATAAIVVGVAIIVLVQLEAHLLQPLIMSRSVELHPLAIALAVLTGTLLSGIVGALLAVPFVAFLNTTISALRAPVPALAEAEPLPDV
jgi:predicted PurR-regulated permease PerM